MKLHAALCAALVAAGSVHAAPQKSSSRKPALDPAKLTVAILPAQAFSADAESAARLTDGVRHGFAARGWKVIAPERVAEAWRALGMQDRVHYTDTAILRVGRKLGVDLVVYPRLLVLGLPVATALKAGGARQPWAPSAVVHVRVLDGRQGRPLFHNQVEHAYRTAETADAGSFRLPESDGRRAAARLLARFFRTAR